MKKIIKQLQHQDIISSQEVSALRQQLIETYPHLTAMERAKFFASALQKQLDTSLASFDDTLRKEIKFNLLKNTLYKKNFYINAYDVLLGYLHTQETFAHPPKDLVKWMNSHQTSVLTEKQVNSLLHSLSKESTYRKKNWGVPLKRHLWYRCSKLLLLLLIISAISFLSAICINLYEYRSPSQYPLAFTPIEEPYVSCPISAEINLNEHPLQKDLQYTTINTPLLKDWLEQKDSLLAEEPYFSAILEAGKEFNVNPLLLFAITGQEQSFVPKDHAFAKQMANNPFNLYGSWETFDTPIKQSSRIAAETILHLGEGCPSEEDQIEWINRSYAEDPNWHIGVSYFFNVLKEIAMS